ncbi:unnamed protein product [Protopolystoma xenopodis]|uniref:Uncharacterized protein n=1 Tax=Protopolystoma xenopodis TaxID=117903 RepID=A0A3S4ZZY8_9PLAT|nr:unnamed protein product [Protopolystoma xenopodis]
MSSAVEFSIRRRNKTDVDKLLNDPRARKTGRSTETSDDLTRYFSPSAHTSFVLRVYVTSSSPLSQLPSKLSAHTHTTPYFPTHQHLVNLLSLALPPASYQLPYPEHLPTSL